MVDLTKNLLNCEELELTDQWELYGPYLGRLQKCQYCAAIPIKRCSLCLSAHSFWNGLWVALANRIWWTWYCPSSGMEQNLTQTSGTSHLPLGNLSCCVHRPWLACWMTRDLRSSSPTHSLPPSLWLIASHPPDNWPTTDHRLMRESSWDQQYYPSEPLSNCWSIELWALWMVVCFKSPICYAAKTHTPLAKTFWKRRDDDMFDWHSTPWRQRTRPMISQIFYKLGWMKSWWKSKSERPN